ncbi:MAG: hypothetical protein HYU52_16815, partial [Acidobacteria bacterium]|nr:hypothetical protein [Acidobacteriota bacterium]
MLRFAALLLSFVFAAPVLLAEAAPKIEALRWMSGSWSLTVGDRIVEEVWLPPSGGTIIGAGRTVSEGMTKFFEFLRVVEREKALVYIAMPRGGKSVEFPSVRLEAQRVVFQNLEHDFPQTIQYWRDGEK